MDKTAIKKFAIESRNKLIDDIKLRLAALGITDQDVAKRLDTSTAEVSITK